jgi:hypothetical protein
MTFFVYEIPLLTPVAEIQYLTRCIGISECHMNTHVIGDLAIVVVLKADEKVLNGKI